MNRYVIALLAVCLAASAALADNDKDKDKDKGQGQGQAQSQGQGQGNSQGHGHGEGQGNDQGKKGEPPGQQVSGCNHQANDLDIKGQERKAFVDRCIARGGDQYDAPRSTQRCRERAENMGLKGAARDDFLRSCRQYQDEVYLYGTKGAGRNCGERAADMGLKGDAKDDFVRRCRQYRDGNGTTSSGKNYDEQFNPRDTDNASKKNTN